MNIKQMTNSNVKLANWIEKQNKNDINHKHYIYLHLFKGMMKKF